MVVCSKCGHRNEGLTAYCRRCAALLPTEGSHGSGNRSSSRGRTPTSPRNTSRDLPPGFDRRHTVTVRLVPFWRRHWPKLFLIAAIAGCLGSYRYFWTIDRRLNLRGHRFGVFSLETDHRFFAGIQQDVKARSESSLGLDTRFFSMEALETGVLELRRSADLTHIEVRADSWIRQEQSLESMRSIAIPLTDPSLALVRVSIDPTGQIDNRPSLRSSRTGRALPLIFPRWPDRTLARGDSWQEKAEWLESLMPWVFEWKGTLRWQLMDYEPCGSSHCARFSYQGSLLPKLYHVPAWAAEGLDSTAHFRGYAKGVALFDVLSNRLVENTFTYEGEVRVGFSDLRLLPEDVRTLELHEKTPGSLVFQINEKISVTRP